jgi:hypothetical protein
MYGRGAGQEDPVSDVVYVSKMRIERKVGPLSRCDRRTLRGRSCQAPGFSSSIDYVALQLVASEESRDTVERVHGIYPMRCPLYRTLHKAIQLSSSRVLVSSKSI